MAEFITKDSGERATFESGMQRDTDTGKARFDLLVPEGVPYEDQMLTRFAALMARGAEKYEDRNWELAEVDGPEMARFKSSAFRHFMQWLCGERDEDHAVAIFFNVLAFESITSRHQHTLDKLESLREAIFDVDSYDEPEIVEAPIDPSTGTSSGLPGGVGDLTVTPERSDPERRRTGWEWAWRDGISILDPDGWRRDDGVDLATPITHADYVKRVGFSTISAARIPKI